MHGSSTLTHAHTHTHPDTHTQTHTHTDTHTVHRSRAAGCLSEQHINAYLSFLPLSSSTNHLTHSPLAHTACWPSFSPLPHPPPSAYFLSHLILAHLPKQSSSISPILPLHLLPHPALLLLLPPLCPPSSPPVSILFLSASFLSSSPASRPPPPTLSPEWIGLIS